MSNEKVSALPSVASATTADTIYAIQGGVSVKETIAQVLSLALTTNSLTYAGNPNGNLAGTVLQTCWDTVNNFLWVCSTSGTSSTAVWKQVVSGSGVIWTEVTGTTQTMAVSSGYIANNAALVTLTLPSTSTVGSVIYINGKGAGGWSIAQAAGQSIHVGSAVSTTGVGGSVASTNRYDSVCLVCITANTEWAVQSAPQSSGLTIV